MEVIASCSHDTAAAVAAVPARGSDWAYISSGTWSLMGVETDTPVLTDLCRELNFTNEIGFGGSVRLLKNIVGLWIVQECRREWAAAGRDFDYATLTRLADEASDGALINPADRRFLTPSNMPAKIAAYCRETGQKAPEEPGAVVRCALQSLALQYRKVVREIERLIGRSIRVIHIVGGGSKNRLLNQFTANATGAPVLAGPVEATALGNVLVQAITLGELRSLAEARQMVATSFPLETFEPAEKEVWEAAADRFAKLPA
jgi:rhamnulokinase